MEPRVPLVSINIPCYHQLTAARRCIEAMLAQSFGDFEITLLDDGASDEYAGLVESLATRACDTSATRSAGRDAQHVPGDHRRARQVHAGLSRGRPRRRSLSRDRGRAFWRAIPACGFVGGGVARIRRAAAGRRARLLPAPPAVERFATRADFLRAIFRGVEPMFGSVVYRRAAVERTGRGARAVRHARRSAVPDVDPGRWSGAIIRDPLVWYRQAWRRRRPPSGDERRPHPAAVRYLPRRAAGAAQRRRSVAVLLLRGYWLFTLYRLTPPAGQSPLRRFVFRAWRDGLYNPKWSRGYGRKRLIALMLTGQ